MGDCVPRASVGSWEAELFSCSLLRSARLRQLSAFTSSSMEPGSCLAFFCPGSSSVTQLQSLKHSCSALSLLVSRRLLAFFSNTGDTLELEAVGYCSTGVKAFRGDGVFISTISDLGVRVTQALMDTLEADICLGDEVEASAFCLVGVWHLGINVKGEVGVLDDIGRSPV